MSSAEDLSRLDAIEKALLNRWPETRIAPTLERISTLADYLGSPQLSYPTIHIAGTNGKTTTTRLIDSLCFELGMRTGRFTSPHLESFLERITINGQSITPEFMIATYNDIAPYLELVDSKIANKLSFFESMCALAFAAFAEFPVDVGIFECGMGGEWDSTNVINGSVNVITPIGFDHMEYLGDTLEKIAQTKSGIIKQDSFVVLAEQESDVAAVLMRACAKADATPIRSGIEFSLKSRALALGGQML
ncbi:MAG: bifunctional folylpolyglutamate synthase/dihydrofolate synthase, partial [Actinomycetota bacterium]